MKTSSILFLGFISLVMASCSSTKLIIDSNKDKHKLKLESTVAITLKGEAYPFDLSCKSTCKSCDEALAKARWSIDSLEEDAMVLRYIHSYEFDTLSNLEFKELSKSERKKDLFRVLVIGKKPAYVYKIPKDLERKRVRYDELATITYSDRPECYKGSPIKAIFHKPNKIRKIEMPGAEIRLKRKD